MVDGVDGAGTEWKASLDGPVAAVWRRDRSGQLSPAILGRKEGVSCLLHLPRDWALVSLHLHRKLYQPQPCLTPNPELRNRVMPRRGCYGN